MARVFIIGVTGGVGSRAATQLVARGDDVVGLHRRPEQAIRLAASGVVPVLGDLLSSPVDDLASKMAGADAVVSAAAAAGVSRFLLVSAFPDAWRDRRMPPEFEHYMKVKRQADAHLATTHLDWIIVRPGTLTNDTGTGRVRLGPVIPYGGVSRDDVAAVLAELVHATHVRRVVLELTNGDTPIREAVASATTCIHPGARSAA